MVLLCSRTIVLGFIVIFLAINIAYAPPKKKGPREIEHAPEEDEINMYNYLQRSYTSEIEEVPDNVEESNTSYNYLLPTSSQDLSTTFSKYHGIPENYEDFSNYNYLQQEILPVFESLAITTQDLTDEQKYEIEVCCNDIIFHFDNNDGSKSCKSYAMLHLTINTESMMGNNYARKYYLYLATQISCGTHMQTPEAYCLNNPDLSVTNDLSLEPATYNKLRRNESLKQSKSVYDESSSEPVTNKKLWKNESFKKKKNKDVRISILENEFGTSVEQALFVAYNNKVIDGLKTYDIRHQYMTHLNNNLDFKSDAMNPREFCEWQISKNNMNVNQ